MHRQSPISAMAQIGISVTLVLSMALLIVPVASAKSPSEYQFYPSPLTFELGEFISLSKHAPHANTT
jgi:hypothetical protein